MNIYDWLRSLQQRQSTDWNKYIRISCLVAIFGFSALPLFASPTCPQCGNKTVIIEDGLICNHCGYSSKIVSCNHSGACNCATSDSALIDSENDQLLKTCGGFLTSDQSMQLLEILGTGQSYRLLFQEWGLIESEFPVVMDMSSSSTRPWEGGATKSQDSATFSPALFLLANGGLQINFEDLQDVDKDWYESLSAMTPNLMGQGLLPAKPLLKSVQKLLEEDHYMLSNTPLPALACSAIQQQIVIAVVSKSMVYFHGLAIKKGCFLYFIPNSGVHSINIDLLEEMLEELKGNASVYIFIKNKPQQK